MSYETSLHSNVLVRSLGRRLPVGERDDVVSVHRNRGKTRSANRSRAVT